MSRRRGFRCTSCGVHLNADETTRCIPCSAPAVRRGVQQFWAAVKPEPEEKTVAISQGQGHGPDLCEDAPACLVCRERLGLSELGLG